MEKELHSLEDMKRITKKLDKVLSKAISDMFKICVEESVHPSSMMIKMFCRSIMAMATHTEVEIKSLLDGTDIEEMTNKIMAEVKRGVSGAA